jgi:hypothetical protein
VDRFERRFPFVIANSFVKVLRRPFESALDQSVGVVPDPERVQRVLELL